MRVLIVGCGYVGLPLGARLARDGHEVYGLRRNPAAEPELRRAGIRPLFADITRPGELEKLPPGFDWVVNCVAAGGERDNYQETYFEGNARLLEWLSQHPPQKFVYTSSTGVYGQNDGSWVDETSPVEPAAQTSQILVATENLLLRAATPSGRASGQTDFPAIILRVAGIYGPERGRGLKLLLRGEAKIEGEGARYMNMIHRDDVGGCIIAALQKGRPGQIYNAIDNEPVTQLDFYLWLAGILGKERPKVEPENPMRPRGLTNKRVSNAKLREELEYTFEFPDFRSGYAREIARLREAGRL
jgi:nucleoside-diphosphate-sugar epimerase